MKKISRALLRAVFALLLIASIGAGTAYLVLFRSLPKLDGEIAVEHLDANVTIERDAAGIPTITATNRNDLAFATGYVHAQDRFFQMDLMRRQAAGELAALAGGAALSIDKRIRLHRFRHRARAALALASTDERTLLRAYANGVNAGIEGLAAYPFEYQVLRTDPLPWRPEDSFLASLAMFMELNDERATRDVQRGLVHSVLPQAVFDWMYPEGTDWDAPLQGSPRTPASIPGPEILNLRNTLAASRPVATEQDADLMPGSNNWAVSGALTQSGHAIVANDMHLGIRVPNTFYRARLVQSGSEPRSLTGVTLPGAPVLIVGSNGRIAWGFTNSNGDWSDAVILRPGPDPDTYLTPEGVRSFSSYREVIEVKGAEPFELQVQETIWGPVLDGEVISEQALAVSWIAQEPEALNLGLLSLETARSVAEALDAANQIGMPPQNFVCGDVDGNIGWTIAGKIPRRTNYDATIPVDWSEQQGWNGWLEPADYPRIVNPPEGRIWTANARVVDAGDLQKIGDGGYALGARAAQIRDGLYAIDKFSPDDMLPIQTDDRAIFLGRWRDLLLAILDADATRDNEGRRLYRELVDGWVARASADSTGYRLVRAFRTAVQQRVFNMLIQPVTAVYGEDVSLSRSRQFEGPLWSLLKEQPMHLLAADYASWTELMLAAVDENLDYFEKNFAGSLEQRSWGERNMAAIRHPLSSSLPQLSRWLDMTLEPLDGDGNMPRAQGPAFGASERFAVSPGDEASSYLHMPTGQSGHPLSDFYRQGHNDWVQGRATRFLPGSAIHTLTLLSQ